MRHIFISVMRSIQTLLKRSNDATRSRNFFEHHLTHMMPLKRAWFREKDNVDWLMVDDLSREEVRRKVKEWCDTMIQKENHI